MITFAQAVTLKHGDIILEPNGVDKKGNPKYLRWRVTSKIKTWKTRPGEFQFSVKYGLYSYGVINHMNCQTLILETET